MSRTKAIVGKEAKIKNKVCAGLEVVANDPTHLINPSSRFGGSVLSAKPTTKRAARAPFFVAERVGSHTCAFLNAQGAQVCAKRKPDEPDKSDSGEKDKFKE